MNKLFYLLVILLLIFSCKTEFEDVESYSVLIERKLKRGKFKDLREMYQSQNDSIKNLNSYYIHEAFDKFKNEKIKKVKSEIDGTQYNKTYRIYYKSESKSYVLILDYDSYNINGLKLQEIKFENMKSMCEREKENPYCPADLIEFRKVYWNTFEQNKIAYGRAEVKNNTNFDIEYLKFKVRLLRWEESQKKTGLFLLNDFFNQTVVFEEKIFKEDVVVIPIDEMTNFYTGFRLQENSFDFDLKLIEVRPNPNAFWCDKLQEIEGIKVD